MLPAIRSLRSITVSELRSKMKEELENAQSAGEPVALMQGDACTAVLIPRPLYEALVKAEVLAVQTRRAATPRFPAFVSAAGALALADEASGLDGGELRDVLDLCRRGPAACLAQLQPADFLRQCLWTIGSIQKRYEVRVEYWEDQKALFFECDPAAIHANRDHVRAKHAARKSYLNRRMVEAILEIAARIQLRGWPAFRQRYLVLPSDPAATDADAWQASYWALRDLPMVGDAISWYLLRNLFGAPCFKPDLHIHAIANHWFAREPDKLNALAAATAANWEVVVALDPRFAPFHLGVADYLLWWYRRRTGLPGDGTIDDGEANE